MTPFPLPPSRLNLCMCTHRLKLCTNSSFNVLSEKKKGKKWFFSEARGQSIPKRLFQNSSASAAASWLPTAATPAFLSLGVEGARQTLSKVLFPEVKRGGRGAADPHGSTNHYRAKLRSPGRLSPMLLQANPLSWKPPKSSTYIDHSLTSSAASPRKEKLQDHRNG